MTDPDKVPKKIQIVKPSFSTLYRILGKHAEMRAYLVWVPRPRDDGGFDKMPCDPTNGSTKKPNSARDRAVLTLREAEQAMESLTRQGFECGIGVLASRAGLTALDLDRVVTQNGTLKIEGWADWLSAASYCERSPGGKGLRMLFAGVPPDIEAISNGTERNQIGVYGARAAKFMTLTGMKIHDSELLPMSDETATRLLDRWRAGKKDKGGAASRPWTGHEAGDGYPRGRAGMDTAQEDILSGASLHPALTAFLVRAAREYAIDEAEELAWSLYHQSEAKQKDPERWAARVGSIPGIVKWIREQGGYIRPAPSPQRSQAVKGLIVSLAAAREARAAEAAAKEAETGGPLVLGRNLMSAGIEISQSEADWLEETTGEPWHQSGKDGVEMILALREVQEESAAAAELEDAKAAMQAREGNDPERHRWMLIAPSYHFSQIARHLHQSMAMDMPGMAAIGALTALSTLNANRYYVEGKYQTPLNLYTVGTGPTGSGKDAIVKFVAEAGHIAEVSTSSRVTSAGAIHELLLRGDGKASIVVDEFAKVLRSQKQDTSGNSTGAAAVMLSAFGSGLDVLPEQTYSQRATVKRAVAFPYLVTFGASTGAALEEVLDSKLVSDGTLNRSILIDSERANGGRWPVLHQPPRKGALIEELSEAFSMAAYLEHPAERKEIFYQRVKDEDGVWVTRESAKVRLIMPQHQWFWLREELETLEAELGDLGELAARFERNATVVAGLLRLGDCIPALDDGYSPLVISDEQMRWAIRFVGQSIRELAQRFSGSIAEGEADEVLIDTRRRLIKELDAKTRTAYGRKYAEMLDQGLVPSALLARCLPKARIFEHAAFIASMEDQGWVTGLSEAERAALIAGRRGKPAKAVYRAEAALYG
jgi:hypothetical protein